MLDRIFFLASTRSVEDCTIAEYGPAIFSEKPESRWSVRRQIFQGECSGLEGWIEMTTGFGVNALA